MTIDAITAERFFDNYYSNQVLTGAGAPRYYRGSTFSRGHWFGNFLSSLVKFLKPVGKTLARSGVKALAGVADDVISGVSPKEAAKRRALQEFDTFKSDAIKYTMDTLRPPKRPKLVAQKRKKKNRKKPAYRF